MCGIAGFWTHKDLPGPEDSLLKMTQALAHRGPDHQGLWSSENKEINLGHRRLSIIDLSPAGNQPMQSHCGRFWMVYNGEIYNHLNIRNRLATTDDAPEWRGHSDSETLLAAISAWGFSEAVRACNGMFAIAVWDTHERALLLARDRLGEKPLYYGLCQGVFMFGSELKALKAHPAWDAHIDQQSLDRFFSHANVPAPQSIYTEVAKLSPAHMVKIQHPDDKPSPTCYWDVKKTASDHTADLVNGSDEQILDMLESRLLDAVSSRLVSDVPVGVFLSGGIDSSLVTALMQKSSNKPVQSFTIGFEEENYNEAEHAKAVAAHIGTDHTEMYVDQQQALDLIPQLPQLWDEPFADASQIPTYLVSKLTRQSVTVSLSGDGGDELFYGYSRYQEALGIWSRLSRYPTPLRQALGKMAGISTASLALLFHNVPHLQSSSVQKQLLRLANLAPLIASANSRSLYTTWITQNRRSPLKHAARSRHADSQFSTSPLRMQDQMMLDDTLNYLPDTVLTKVDRASMAVGLETRAPLLEHSLVEWTWRLKPEMKFRDDRGKWALREVLYRHVPRQLVDRPKVGFGVPIDHWLRSSLRDWGEHLLDPRALAEQGFLDVKHVRQMWEQHVSGTMDWQYQLWPILMFQAWHAEHHDASKRL